jgi:hypothetical protein
LPAAALLVVSSSLPAQTGTGTRGIAVPELTASERAALETIEEHEVAATVGFLASDEMAGRNTPSPELNIASAYVAARFRGAGLEGLGPDGSFYLTRELRQYAVPLGQATMYSGDQSVPLLGALFAPASASDMTARTTTSSEAGEANAAIVIVDDLPLPPQAADNPGMLLAAWSRRLQPLVKSGAAGVMIRAAEDSVLPAALETLQSKPVTLPLSMVLDVPVVVLPAGSPVPAEVTLKTPARRDVLTPVHNVVGIVRGRDPELSKQCLLISAHLDHIGIASRSGSGDTINNGADDNATGVTGVLMLADAFAALDPAPQRSVMFVTFWGEEKGLLGSQEFAANSPWPLSDIVANLNLEMLGRPESGAENKGWCTGWTHSDFGELLAAGAQRANVTIFRHDRFDEMLYSRSDNFSFVQKGVIAHSVSAGSLHDDYHQPGDEVSKLNLPHMTAVIRGLFAGSLPIAEGQWTPVRR